MPQRPLKSNLSSPPFSQRKHINKSYSVEHPEFWPVEHLFRELEFENPDLKRLPYFQELRQNMREQSDKDEREPRISVARVLSLVREPPVERETVKDIPTYSKFTRRSFIDSVLTEGVHRLRYLPPMPPRQRSIVPWRPYKTRAGETGFTRLVEHKEEGSLIAYDLQIMTQKGLRIRKVWSFRVLRYDPLISAMYLGNDRWAVVNLQTNELLFQGKAEGLLPVRYGYPDKPIDANLPPWKVSLWNSLDCIAHLGEKNLPNLKIVWKPESVPIKDHRKLWFRRK